MSNLYNRIDALCKNRGISITVMCKNASVSRASLSDLKMGRNQNLSAETLSKIADFFNTTTDYLLGKEIEKMPTDNGERDILDEIDIGFYGDYKALTENDQETLRAMARLMRERRAQQDAK